jgi:hypothetical protein
MLKVALGAESCWKLIFKVPLIFSPDFQTIFNLTFGWADRQDGS